MQNEIMRVLRLIDEASEVAFKLVQAKVELRKALIGQVKCDKCGEIWEGAQKLCGCKETTRTDIFKDGKIICKNISCLYFCQAVEFPHECEIVARR